jgi:hypothetical protein
VVVWGLGTWWSKLLDVGKNFGLKVGKWPGPPLFSSLLHFGLHSCKPSLKCDIHQMSTYHQRAYWLVSKEQEKR